MPCTGRLVPYSKVWVESQQRVVPYFPNSHESAEVKVRTLVQQVLDQVPHLQRATAQLVWGRERQVDHGKRYRLTYCLLYWC